MTSQRRHLFHERCFRLQVFSRVSSHLYWGKFLHLSGLHHVFNLMRNNSQPCCTVKLIQSTPTAHAMLDVPAWPVRRRITRDWNSFSHSNQCAKYREKKLIMSKKAAEIFIDICECTKTRKC